MRLAPASTSASSSWIRRCRAMFLSCISPMRLCSLAKWALKFFWDSSIFVCSMSISIEFLRSSASRAFRDPFRVAMVDSWVSRLLERVATRPPSSSLTVASSWATRSATAVFSSKSAWSLVTLAWVSSRSACLSCSELRSAASDCANRSSNSSRSNSSALTLSFITAAVSETSSSKASLAALKCWSSSNISSFMASCSLA
mmetsp:Transcript_74070/g.130728  ORF Transcript_74070/g.130728 Transcript_74070/m.130728 type:complete len:200 (+) Transcript_74070:1108-1707(+)